MIVWSFVLKVKYKKKRKNGQNSIDLWSHLFFGIIWSWKKGSFKLNFWSNLAPRETINVRLIQFSNQIETIGAQECLKNILSVTIVTKIWFFNQIETSAAQECLNENILSITIVIKILFFNQIETRSWAQECLNFFRVSSLFIQNYSIFQPNLLYEINASFLSWCGLYLL